VRRILAEVPALDQLGLPPIVASLARKARGLILVTGPTGAGKSTTLAALVDLINRERAAHIVTLEDPIEFVHPHRRSLVDQREIGTDAPTFADALRNAHRQDPDVLLVGERRDAESLATALTIAETGHLTLGSLHTNSAAQTIHRILDVFPAAQQPQIRAQLALTLEAVLCQQLVPRAGGGRVPAVEVLVATPAVRTLIREDRVHQLSATIQAGRRFGMQTLNHALSDLIHRGLVNRQDAQRYASRHEDLDPLLTDAPPPPAYARD